MMASERPEHASGKHRIENALFALIEMADETAIPHLIKGLERAGDRDVAQAFLNCGHEKLANAARAWASRQGYEIRERGGTRPVVWRKREQQ